MERRGKKLIEVAAWWAAPENLMRCEVCRQACEQDGESPPCSGPAGCQYQPPELEAANGLAWDIYSRVRLCRRGDFQSTLDFPILFRVMDLEGLREESQLEVFNKVAVVEAELQRIWAQERDKKQQEEPRGK